MQQKSTVIAADLHKRLRLLAVENGTQIAQEHDLALREGLALRERALAKRNAKQQNEQAVAVAQ